jgi:hypothetical protein
MYLSPCNCAAPKGRAGSDSHPDPTLHASLQVPADMWIGEDALLQYICIVLEPVHSNTGTHLQMTDNGVMTTFHKDAQVLHAQSILMLLVYNQLFLLFPSNT